MVSSDGVQSPKSEVQSRERSGLPEEERAFKEPVKQLARVPFNDQPGDSTAKACVKGQPPPRIGAASQTFARNPQETSGADQRKTDQSEFHRQEIPMLKSRGRRCHLVS